ncbi:glucosaminidase domain-containing protein [bacterium]|nr:glucosaminidase domain-containing protein [bacterium]
MKSILALVFVGLLSGCGTAVEPTEGAETAAEDKPSKVASKAGTTPKEQVFASYQELEAYYDSIGYSFENWRNGMRAIPRVYPHDIPQRWKTVSKDLTVDHKKRIFFRALLPLVLRANEIITLERKRAEQVIGSVAAGKVAADDEAWLLDLAKRYGIDAESAEAIDAKSLLIRVDVVPASLALGQAAYESGYATSRFAGLGNALYGQWTWEDSGIKPEQQREGKGDYGIAAFETPLESIRAYQHNLNTHRAYEPLRAKRAELRKAGDPITGLALTSTLTKYSERGEEYVQTLNSIITHNRLPPTDEAYLRDDFTPVVLIPASSKDN